MAAVAGVARCTDSDRINKSAGLNTKLKYEFKTSLLASVRHWSNIFHASPPLPQPPSVQLCKKKVLTMS